MLAVQKWRRRCSGLHFQEGMCIYIMIAHDQEALPGNEHAL